MEKLNITISEDRNFDPKSVIDLYSANHWSSAHKPDQLLAALKNSHSLILAYDGDQLVGLGNAISDGHLVVYYPHLLIHPRYQRKGIGRMIIQHLQQKYCGFHQQMLTADKDAVPFYEKMGFERAGETKPMWIYDGDEH